MAIREGDLLVGDDYLIFGRYPPNNPVHISLELATYSGRKKPGSHHQLRYGYWFKSKKVFLEVHNVPDYHKKKDVFFQLGILKNIYPLNYRAIKKRFLRTIL